jgi:uncharacterized phage protein (TIGR01671 family)
MREIKFKCINKCDNTFLDVWSISVNGDWVQFADQGYLFNDDEVNEFELLQYTGLKDIDGEEIFEGDIVKHFSGLPFLVVWYNQYCGWGLKNKNFTCSLLDYEPSKHYKILGNIYQNPELLEVK